MSEPNAQSLEKPSDLGTDDEAIARRWKLEIKLADKRESEWRKKAIDIYRVYTPETPAANSFNILWTNTETLRQSVYNSLPQPDVRRRYSTEDPLGKAVSEVLTRALEFAQDTYDFDGLLKMLVLSMLLPGRGVTVVKYMPRVLSAEAGVDWESVECENVQWDDFRILCAAKTWEECTAIGFRKRMNREDLCEMFGEEIGNLVPLDDAEDEDVKRSKEADLFKTAAVWQVWDKEAKQVICINHGYPKPLKVQKDPLKLQGFWPTPRPLYAIENNTTLVPAPLFSQYEQQAKELNRVSARINKLVDGLKVRGVYDATVTELSELSKASDYQLIPAQNVTALLERGGLEKAIWMMPIETAAMVLKELYVQRDQCKQVIYEITGISDIMRSATDPAETFGAQKIKTQWGTQRLQRMQREVQRYIRDLLRLKAEIIAEKFQQQTLEKMTLVELPHEAQLLAQFATIKAQAQSTGQPVPPMPPMPVTWEAVMKAMHDDAARTYRIDVETDSTIAATQDADLQGLQATLKGMADLITGFGPAVQAGAIPIDAVKALMGVIARRSRMGSVVEDAFEKIQPPQPGTNPEQMKAQYAQQAQQAQFAHEAQLEQMKAQITAQIEQGKAQAQVQMHQAKIAADMQLKQQEAQIDAQLQAHEQEVQAQQNAHQNMLESQRAQQQAELDAQLQVQKQAAEEKVATMEQQNAVLLAQILAQSKVAVAEVAAGSAIQTAQISAAQQASKQEDVAPSRDTELHSKMDAMVTALNKPKKVVRGPDGKIAGVE